jgi:hypothetical protein
MGRFSYTVLYLLACARTVEDERMSRLVFDL